MPKENLRDKKPEPLRTITLYCGALRPMVYRDCTDVQVVGSVVSFYGRRDDSTSLPGRVTWSGTYLITVQQ